MNYKTILYYGKISIILIKKTLNRTLIFLIQFVTKNGLHITSSDRKIVHNRKKYILL